MGQADAATATCFCTKAVALAHHLSDRLLTLVTRQPDSRSTLEASLDPRSSPMGVPEGLRNGLADRYRLERELGRGGMAIVYLAHDLRHDRPVALKVLHPELSAGLGPERFLREIRTTARLDHPHILPLLDSGEAAGVPPLVHHALRRGREPARPPRPRGPAPGGPGAPHRRRDRRRARLRSRARHRPPRHQAREHSPVARRTPASPTSASRARSRPPAASSPRPDSPSARLPT